jgi:histidine triad (HIT) family protein
VASVFTRIIEGELPGRFVYRDERCVAFLSINPLRPGHVLVVPRLEVEHWIDLPAAEWAHLAEVARRIGLALQRAYAPVKVGAVLAGLEVPHVHVHLVPIDRMEDLDFRGAEQDPDPAALDRAAETVTAALKEELGADPLGR